MLYDHATPRLSELERQMAASIPEGGNWQSIAPGLSARVDQIRRRSAERGIVHTTYYGRLAWDRPSYTVNTYFSRIGNGAFLHPDQQRLISLREGARLQTFPDRVRFLGPRRAQYEQIGNAVPPLLGRAVAATLPTGVVADLFAGAGGLSLGFELAGSVPAFATDRSAHAVATYNAAHDAEVAEVAELGDAAVDRLVAREILRRCGGRPDVLLAGPPCQGFSTAGNRLVSDPRSKVFWSVFEIAAEVRPRVLLVENVQGIMSIAKRTMPRRIAARMRALGLTPAMAVLRAEEYGVPQRRTRVLFVGTSDGVAWTPPEPTRARTAESPPLPAPLTVRDAIADLPPLAPGDELHDVRLATAAMSPLQRWARGEIDVAELREGPVGADGTLVGAA